MKVKIVATTQPLDFEPQYLIEYAGRVCTNTLSRFGQGSERFIRQRIDEQHMGLLEHNSVTFLVEGISRVASHQLVRHRLASYCLSGDTVVISYCGKKGYSPKRWTLEKLYNWSTDKKRSGRLKLIRLRSVNSDGVIIPGEIESIVASGIMDVYRIRTESGLEIKATSEHKILTPSGWRLLKELSVGDRVIANGIPAYKNKEWVEEMYINRNMMRVDVAALAGVSDSTLGKWIKKLGINKPKKDYPNRKPGYSKKGDISEEGRKRISESKLREKNPTWVGDDAKPQSGRSRANRWIGIYGVCDGCGRGDSLERHHMDRNPVNNDIDNIKILCPVCHKAYHIGQAVISVYSTKIIGIEYYGKEMTYDLSMKNEPFNFVANGIVVHNSQLSERFCDVRDTDAVLPASIAAHEDAFAEYEASITGAYTSYERLIKSGIPREDARMVLPQGVETTILVTMNLRSYLHLFDMRIHPAAQWEIREMCIKMLEMLVYYAPAVFVPYREKVASEHPEWFEAQDE